MKKVVNSLLLVLTWPFKFLKKSKFDNFIGGLIFGAIFSLIVNVVTVQIQEIINKQRALEGIENEIVNNMIVANTVYDSRAKNIDESTPINLYYTPTKYSSDVWRQSSEAIGYVSQLESDVQVKIMLYYSMTVPFANSSADRGDNFANRAVEECFTKNLAYDPINKDSCTTDTLIAYTSDKFAAETISNESFEVLKIFHPTKDRLNKWFLRFLMGDKSTRILSGQ